MRRPPWLTRSNVLWGTGIALGLGMAIALVAALATGTLKSGFGADTTTVTSKKIDSQGKVIDTTETTTPQDAKTLWDWLNLGGVLAVPITLAILAAWLQLKEQRRAEQQADLEREIADKNRQQDLEIAQGTREEEALQHYLDRVSNLVIEKNLLAIAAKDAPTTEETELLDASVAVIRILTLSTLRRLSDGVRKASVVRILIDTDILGLRVILEGADLRSAFLVNAYLAGVILKSADLRGAHLEGANLKCANLEGANLEGANLSNATLRGATLRGATLRHTILSVANFTNADLSYANLTDTDLSYTNLYGTNLSYTNLSINTINKRLTKKQLKNAYLCKTTLPEGIDMDPNRDCSKHYDEWLSEKMKARIKEREAQQLQE
jgi:uncharacterized protein YjbI with pentapeptide repeats